MSRAGRVFGHGMGGLFMALGVLFLYMGLNGNIANWFDENSTCQYGTSCPENSARTTFLILGASFFVTGFITSLATEFVIRKSQRMLASVSGLATDPPDTVAGWGEFLKPFGIEIDPSTKAQINVERRTIDLRGQRSGDVPRDPAGLSDYLKSFGVRIDEDLLRKATVVDGGEPQQQAVTNAGERAPGVAAEFESTDLVRETARIIRKQDRGSTSGNQRLVEFELEVLPAGRVPYRVEVASLVRESLAGLLIEGTTLNVRVDPHNRNSVTIDWSEN